MVGIDPRGRESVLLGVRDTLDGECGFPAARGSKEFHHVAPRKSAAKRLIERAEARRADGLRRVWSSPHARQPQQDSLLPLLFLHRFARAPRSSSAGTEPAWPPGGPVPRVPTPGQRPEK